MREAAAKAVQTLCRADEMPVLAFTTAAGKSMSLCVGEGDAWLVYRFGTPAHVELQFPKVLDGSSWKRFTYDFWLRPGGKENAGIDINHVSFENDGYRYSVYHDWSAEDDHVSVGVEVAPEGAETARKIEAGKGRFVGHLLDFRFDWRDRLQPPANR